MSGEVKFFIKRDDGAYYAGTGDRKAVWVKEKRLSIAFKTREQAEPRMAGLTLNDNVSCEIESGPMPVRTVEEVRADSIKPGDCFEDEYETAYELVGPCEKDGEVLIETKFRFNGEPMLLHPEEKVYRVRYV